MNKYLRLFRLGNGVMGLIAVFISMFIAIGGDVIHEVPAMLIGWAVVVLFIIGGNSLNDYVDREIDKTAHPDRPVPMGEITPEAARNIGIAGLALACAISVLTFSIVSTLIVIVGSILMICYETRLKQRGFVGNVTIALLTGMVFLYGGSLTSNIGPNVIIALLAFIVSIGREIAKDIEDMESDEGERLTLPMRIGVRNACIVAAFCLILGPALSFVPLAIHMMSSLYWLVIVADAIFIYVAIIVFRDAHKCEKLAKVAMFVALLAFILGAIR